MRPLSAQQLLRAWEAGRQRGQVDRALLLLAEACPGESLQDLASLPVGHRDERLLRLREWTFGEQLASLASCPACGEQLELSFRVADVRASAPRELPQELTATFDDFEAEFRLPTSVDLSQCVHEADPQASLLHRCIHRALRGGEPCDIGDLPEQALDRVIAAMAEADPQAEVSTLVDCPGCEHAWAATFDIVSLFWEELEGWVHRTLREVHTLAAAYGWREDDVLGLSAWRRRYYLQLVHP